MVHVCADSTETHEETEWHPCTCTWE